MAQIIQLYAALASCPEALAVPNCNSEDNHTDDFRTLRCTYLQSIYLMLISAACDGAARSLDAKAAALA